MKPKVQWLFWTGKWRTCLREELFLVLTSDDDDDDVCSAKSRIYLGYLGTCLKRVERYILLSYANDDELLMIIIFPIALVGIRIEECGYEYFITKL